MLIADDFFILFGGMLFLPRVLNWSDPHISMCVFVCVWKRSARIIDWTLITSSINSQKKKWNIYLHWAHMSKINFSRSEISLSYNLAASRLTYILLREQWSLWIFYKVLVENWLHAKKKNSSVRLKRRPLWWFSFWVSIIIPFLRTK